MSTLTIVSSGARTSDGSQEFGGWTPDLPIIAALDVTAVSGTSPSMSLWLDYTVDGTNWKGYDSATVTAVGVVHKVFESTSGLTRGGLKFRLRWVITGTSPSFTFSVAVNGATEGVR